MDLFWLSDAQWRVVAPLLPSRQSGPQRADDRRVISGILYVLLSGRAWRDCPPEYGPFMTVFNRFNRWRARGIWPRIVAALAQVPDSPLSSEQVDKLRAAIDSRLRANGQAKSQFAAQRLAANRAWEEAAAQLRKIAQAHQGKPVSAWINAVVEWHMDALFELTDRNASAAGDATAQLEAEIAELRTKLLAAIVSLQSFLDDPSRNAATARQQLGKLQEELRRAAMDARPARAS
jgi:transposase